MFVSLQESGYAMTTHECRNLKKGTAQGSFVM